MVVCYFCNSEDICVRYKVSSRLYAFSCKKCIPPKEFVVTEKLSKEEVAWHKKLAAQAEKNSIKWASAD